MELHAINALVGLLLLVGMALSLGDINTVRQKTRAEARSVGAHEVLRALWKHMQSLGNPDLQIVEYAGLGAADKVIADVPCKLYAVFVAKPAGSTTDSWLKGSDHVSAAAANGDLVVKMRGTAGGGKSHCLVFPDGLQLPAGLTLGAHTTVNGNTKSNAADAPTGFAIIGAL